MSTFLELVQDLHRESGAAGVPPRNVENVTGEAARLVNWIRNADLYVQSLWVDWRFLWRRFDTLNVTVAGTNLITKPADLRNWDFPTFKIIEPNSTQQNPLCAIEYDEIKDTILDTSQNIPSRVIVMPNGDLSFEPIPDAGYQIIADYFAKPTLLAANEDISEIPEEYHQVILGRAMILYANHENAPEMKDQGKEIYTEQLARLENTELPNQQNARFKSGGFFQVSAG